MLDFEKVLLVFLSSTASSVVIIPHSERLTVKMTQSKKDSILGNCRAGKKDEPMTVKVGDTVLYGKYAGTELNVEGTDYLIMRESDIFAII